MERVPSERVWILFLGEVRAAVAERGERDEPVGEHGDGDECGDAEGGAGDGMGDFDGHGRELKFEI